MAGQTDMELIKNGVRLDGRKADELREIKNKDSCRCLRQC